MAYKWKVDFYPVPAQVAGEYLENLRVENGGILTPEVVLNASRKEDAVLHSCFEWNDSVAAEKFRLEQSRHLIANITVITETTSEPKTVRAFINISPPATKGKYTTLYIAMNNTATRKQALLNALRELRAFQNKFATYSELADVFKAIDDFADSLADHSAVKENPNE